MVLEMGEGQRTKDKRAKGKGQRAKQSISLQSPRVYLSTQNPSVRLPFQQLSRKEPRCWINGPKLKSVGKTEGRNVLGLRRRGKV